MRNVNLARRKTKAPRPGGREKMRLVTKMWSIIAVSEQRL